MNAIAIKNFNHRATPGLPFYRDDSTNCDDSTAQASDTCSRRPNVSLL